MPLTHWDLSGLPPAAARAELGLRADELQGSLHLGDGPILRVAYFDFGAGAPGRLLWTIHHLVVDGVSWRILLEDLQLAYGALEAGEAVGLAAGTTSYGAWAQGLVAAAGALEEGEGAYWRDLAGAPAPAPLPLDGDGGADLAAEAETVTFELGAEATRQLLQEVPGAYNTRVDDALLAAVARAFAGWTGEASLLLDLEGHGREDLVPGADLSRTVGWFTSIYPVLLQLGPAGSPGDDLRRTKECLRSTPGKGVGFGVLRYLGSEGMRGALAAAPRPQVAFNYLGQLDQVLDAAAWLRPAGEPGGRGSAAVNGRSHLLEINGQVLGGRLSLEWTFSRAGFRRSTVEALAAACGSALEGLIEHCRAEEAGGYTPSDFPEMDLSQEDLDELMDELGATLEERS